jgi:hypothetical protein
MKKNPEFVGQLIPEVSHKCTPGLTFVQCCGSGIRDLVPFDPWIRDPEWFFFRIPELGSWIPNPYFWELSDYFLGKKFHNSLKIGPNFFLQHFKNKIIYNFVKYVTIKKRFETFFFIHLLFAIFGSEIRDPGRAKIRIRDKHPGSATLHLWSFKRVKNLNISLTDRK